MKEGPFQIFQALVRRSWSRRLAVLLAVAACISGFATYAALTATPPFGNDAKTVVWLINLDLIILLLLVVLIARRLARLWSGRRQGQAGSRLQVRLVMIFSIMAAAPAILMAVFAAFFLHFGVQTWFSERVRTAVVESQAVANAYLEEHQQVIKADILAMANDLDRQAILFYENRPTFDRMIETQSLLRNLSEAMIFDEGGRILARSGLTFTLTFESLPDYLLEQAEDGEVVVMTGSESGGAGAEDRVRALVKLSNFPDSYLFVGRMVDPTVLSHLEATRRAAADYAALEGRYPGLQIAVTVIFGLIAFLFLLSAIWFGIVLARQLVTPIGTLIAASDRVRAGDLSARVPGSEDIEEFDYLAHSFNRMTSQIQEQRDELVKANRQLDQRRRFTETVLAGVSAGIIGADERGRITIANTSAEEMIGLRESDLIGKDVSDILPELSGLLKQAHGRPDKISQSQIPFLDKDGVRRILLVRIAIEMIGQEEKGAVLTFDDITELQSAQRKAAWADVARRIAHEIKNPLTPIQLSAERLKRKYLGEVKTDPDTFARCTDTIIRHVGDIGRMVNEFSAFARMPEPVMQEEDLGQHIAESLTLYKEAHPDIRFTLRGAGTGQAIVNCDSQQVRQAFTNLLENAVEAVRSRMKEEPCEGKIDIFLSPFKGDKECIVSVSDNGIGLPRGEDPASLSEPYVTHREKGTGLGLAIVKKIIEDHGGRLVIGAPDWLRALSGWQDLGGASVSLVFPLQALRVEPGRTGQAA